MRIPSLSEQQKVWSTLQLINCMVNQLWAHNEIGLSDEDSIIVRTAKGMVNVIVDQLYG
jgi:hypothetical protein